MTVSSTLGRDISVGNGSTTVFTVPFRILDKTHLRVVKYTIATGATADLVQDTDYTVQNVGSTNAQYTTIGASSPYSSAYKLVAIRAVPMSQGDDYVENSAFPAETVEAEFDKLTMIAQQHQDLLYRAAVLPEFAATSLRVVLPIPTDGYGFVWDGATGNIRNTTVSLATLETQAAALYAIAANITTVAGISSNVTSVAANASNINTVAGISGNVTTVAGISGNVTSVAANASNINTVAGISSNVTTVAGVATSVSTVAGISGNVTTVAGISADVTTVAGVATSISTLAPISASITTVAGVSTAVSTVATNIADVSSCSTNIAAIIAAPAAAVAAAASAASAAASASGISMRGSCRVCTTGALTVTYANGILGVGATLTNAGAQAAFASDGVTVSVGERVLVQSQASAFQNGIYTLTVAGSGATNWVLTRATDYDEASEIVEGTATIIEEGTVNASHIYVMTHHGAITVGTTAIDFTALTANATSANTLTTPRAIYGNNFDGSAALTQVIASTYGGTGNGFTKFSGPTSSEKTWTGPDASCSLLTTNAAVTVAQGGTGVATLTTAYGVLCAGTTATGTVQTLSALGASGTVLTSNGAGALPSFQAAAAQQVVLLATRTAATSSTLDFTSVITSSYDSYLLVIKDLICGSTASTLLLCASDNATFTDTMASQVAACTADTNAPTYTGTADTSSGVIIVPSIAGASAFCGTYSFSTGVRCSVGDGFCTSAYFSHTVKQVTFSSDNGGGNTLNAIRLKPSTGTFTSGKAYLFGFKNT